LVVGTSENIPFPEALDYDLSVSSQNILLQVAEEGLGAVWLSVAPYKDRMEYVRAELKIPEGKYPFSLIPIGYSREKNRFIDRFDSSKIYYNNY
ncbi:MAG: nitroreductase family protein, partial [Cetobacterium sp.]